jgi:hypothetical protein
VQDRQEQERRRLAEIDQLPQRRVGQDLARREQVLLDDRGVRDVVQHGPGVRQDHGVMVDVDHPGRRIGLLGDLMGVAHRGQPGADVDDLPDAGLTESYLWSTDRLAASAAPT